MFVDGSFPGYPGPLDPRRGIKNVTYPILPMVPVGVAASWQAPPMSGPGAEQPVDPAAFNPLGGLQAHGVPVGFGPGGRPVLQAGMATGLQMPPNLAGMPSMPTPPPGMFGGGAGAGGLLQPTAAVSPFDPSNQVRRLQVQQSPN